VRVWTDGCFDMMHFGHANCLRQAKALGGYLIVGVHSDAEIRRHKGPPVMSEAERYAHVRACKWVDEVVEGAPYVTELKVLENHRVDFCVHGDDIVVSADGEDTYAEIKAAGRFRTVARTGGISSTDLVGRMLLMTKEHHRHTEAALQAVKTDELRTMTAGSHAQSPYTGVSHFLPTSRKIVQFSEGREPTPDDVVVYVDGGFDMFHVGHIAALEAARTLGTYLVVGLHTDAEINRIKGSNWPIMNMHERVLSVLSCRHVDEVVIGAPYAVTEELIESMRIKFVAHGANEEPASESDGSDPYAVAKRLGIYRQVNSESTLTTSEIVDRLIANRDAFVKRNHEKESRELAQIQNRQS
jgi:ethanolamine-phosphate cytidylyltransferase